MIIQLLLLVKMLSYAYFNKYITVITSAFESHYVITIIIQFIYANIYLAHKIDDRKRNSLACEHTFCLKYPFLIDLM